MSSGSTEWLKRRTITVFGLLILGYLLVGSVKLILENYQVQQQAKRLTTDVENLRQDNSQLKNLLAYYRTDSYKEKEARLRLNFIKPGERVVAVPLRAGDDESTITQPGPEAQPPTAPSNPRQWLDYFFARRG